MRKRITILILLLASVSQALAQSPVSQTEAKKRKAEMTRKALILADEAIESAQSLKLPENRIRLQIGAADLLWPHDDKRARGLFKNAAEALSEIQAAEMEKDIRQHQGGFPSMQIRQEMLAVVAKYDPALAIQFVRATRLPSRDPALYYNQPDPEVNMEIKLAQQIAAKDPAEGLRIAQEALNRGVDHDILSLLYQLRAHKKELAASLCASIIKRLRSEDLSKNPVSANVALTLLRMGAEPQRTQSEDSIVVLESLSSSGMARDLFQPRDLADLAGIVARYAMKVIAEDVDGYSGVNIANMVRPMLPDIEKYAPTQAQLLRESFAEFEKSIQAVKHPSTKIYEQMQNSTIEGLFELAKNATPEMQNNIYQNAAWRLLGEGKIEQARQVVTEKVSNPIMRAEMLDQLERQQLIQASSTGKVDEALEQVSRLRSVEERVELLLNIATNVFAAGDKKKGLQVLAEARSLIANRVDNYAQLSAQLQVARALLPHDAEASFSIIEPLIEHLNRLIAASSILSGFEIPEYFRRGEMVLQMGGSLTNYIHEYSQILGELARRNLDRAKSLADGFQLHEIRAMVYISMAVNLLKEDEEESSPGEGVESVSRLNVRIRQE